jgi:hypothetical protein
LLWERYFSYITSKKYLKKFKARLIEVSKRLGFAIISSESTLVTSPFLILESLSDVQINELQLDNQGEGRTQSRSFSTHQ